jgi:hypothetical protein
MVSMEGMNARRRNSIYETASIALFFRSEPGTPPAFYSTLDAFSEKIPPRRRSFVSGHRSIDARQERFIPGIDRLMPGKNGSSPASID